MSITAEESGVGGTALRQLFPAPGCTLVGPFISFEHSWPDISNRPEGIHLSMNTAAETAAISYVFHTERTGKSPDKRDGADAHCVNGWIAIPAGTGGDRPAVEHVDTSQVPVTKISGITIRVILGEALGKASDLLRDCPATLLDCAMAAGSQFKLPGNIREPAVYVVCGLVKIDGRRYAEGTLAVCSPGWPTTLTAESSSLMIILGGTSPRLARQAPKWDW